MSEGFKYFECFLKPTNYKKQDWDWIVNKFKKMLTCWDHKWLSLGGKVIMTKAFLQGLPIFWMHLFHIPQSIIHDIESIIAKFIWYGVGSCRKIHLAGLSTISRPVKMGSWGILDLRRFNIALMETTLWRAFRERGL